MRYSLLLSVAFLGLAGCVATQNPGPQMTTTTYTPATTTTYVTPVQNGAYMPPNGTTTTYVGAAPAYLAPTSTTTVVRTQ
jgi:hypothetical protein